MVQTPDLESGSDWLDEAADSLLEGTAINSHIVPQNAYVPCIPGIQKEDFPSSPWTGDLSLYNWTFEDTTFDFLLPEPSPCSLDQPSSDPSPQLELCSITGIEELDPPRRLIFYQHFTQYFLPYMPTLHESTIQRRKEPPIVLSILAIGACFARDEVMADRLLEKAKSALEEDQMSPATRLQVLLHLSSFSLWNGSEGDHEWALSKAQELSRILQVVLRKETLCGQAPTWQEWMRREECLRAIISTFTFFCQLDYFFHVSTSLWVSDMDIPLPAPEKLWRIDSEAAWDLLSPIPEPPYFLHCFYALINVDSALAETRDQISYIGRNCLIHAVLSYIQRTKQDPQAFADRDAFCRRSALSEGKKAHLNMVLNLFKDVLVVNLEGAIPSHNRQLCLMFDTVNIVQIAGIEIHTGKFGDFKAMSPAAARQASVWSLEAFIMLSKLDMHTVLHAGRYEWSALASFALLQFSFALHQWATTIKTPRGDVRSAEDQSLLNRLKVALVRINQSVGRDEELCTQALKVWTMTVGRVANFHRSRIVIAKLRELVKEEQSAQRTETAEAPR